MLKYAVVEVKFKKESEDRYEDFTVVSHCWNISDIKEAEQARSAWLLSSSWHPSPQNIQVIQYAE